MKKQKIEGQQIPELGIDLYEVILMHLDDPRDIVKLITMNKRIWSRYKKHKKYLRWKNDSDKQILNDAVKYGMKFVVDRIFKNRKNFTEREVRLLIMYAALVHDQPKIFKLFYVSRYCFFPGIWYKILTFERREVLEFVFRNMQRPNVAIMTWVVENSSAEFALYVCKLFQTKFPQLKIADHFTKHAEEFGRDDILELL